MYSAESFGELYDILRGELLEAPSVIVRGLKTHELSPAYLHIRNPKMNLFYHPARKFHLPFAIAESILLFSRQNRAKYLGYFNPRILDYSDDGKTLYGSYGWRVAKQWSLVTAKLVQDLHSRQAILTISTMSDLAVKTKDFPCTIALHFMIRGSELGLRLDLHVYMRSNDFYWGLPYDVFSFTTAQQIIANQLGVDVGHYYHSTSSLHVYEQHYERLSNICNVESGGIAVDYILIDIQTLGLWMTRGLIDGKRIPLPLGSPSIFSQILTNEANWRNGKQLVKLPNLLDKIASWRWSKPYNAENR